LSKFYLKPDLVLFLDAPPEVLYARKGESTLEHLESRRNAIPEQGKKMDNFIVVDATQPLTKVFADVSQYILEFHASLNTKTVDVSGSKLS
jgi:thymidylate kinase